MVSLFLFEYKACGIVLDALKGVNVRLIDARQEGIAIVNSRHDETEDKLDSCFGSEVLSD